MIEIADNERLNMASGTLAERAGSSGGFVFSNSNSKSLTSCTNASEKNKSLLVPCPNSVGATIHYQQDDGKYRKFAGVYNQTKGKRYDKIEKSELEELIVTDSIPPRISHNKVKVLSCAPLFAEVMKNVHYNQSISSKFVM